MDAESAVRAAVAGRAGNRVLVLAGQALHELHAGLSGPGDGGRAGGGWLAAGGRGGWEPWLLGAAIGLWVGGFDVLYACQDEAFDRAHGLRSIPVRFGDRAFAADLACDARRRRRVHGAAGAVVVPLGPIYLVGVVLVARC